MRYFLVMLLGAWFLGASALAAEPPDVTLVHPDGKREPFRSEDRSPEAIYKLLEEVCEQKAAPGRVDSVILHTKATGGRFDILDLSRLAYFVGEGQQKSVLMMTAQHDNDGPTPENRKLKPPGPAIELGERGPRPIRIRHITLQNHCHELEEDGALVGWGADGEGDAEFEDVSFDGSRQCDWVIYSWKKGTFRIVLDHCRVFHCRLGIALCDNQATYDVTMRNCLFAGDANHSVSFSETSAPDPVEGGVLGNIIRGKGTWTVENCEFWLRGLTKPYNTKWTVPRICALGNHYFTQSNKDLEVSLKNVRVRHLEPGTATVVSDLDFRFGVVPVIDGVPGNPDARGGTGPDGTFRRWSAN